MRKEEALNEFLSNIQFKDEKIDSFVKSFNNWTISLSSEAASSIYELLSKFEYYSHQKQNIILVELYKKLIPKYGEEQDFLFTYIKKKNGQINSSIDYFCEFRFQNKVDKSLCCDDLNNILGYLEYINNIVVIDDICGSGDTIDTFIQNNSTILEGKNIYYLVIYAMKGSLQKIQEIERNYNVRIELIPYILHDKAFKENPKLNDLDKKQVINFSKEIGIETNDILGRKESEALVAFSNNTPNNTIGLFWYDSDVYKAPFSRVERKMPPWKKMKMDAKRRKKSNYDAKKYR